MGYKDEIKKRTYRNAHVLNLSYKDKNGIDKTEEVILKKSNSFLGDWKKIHPIINKDDSINWMNFIFGGWRNVIKLTFIGLFVLYLIFGMFGEITKYMDGNKYIIIEKDIFNKFCSTKISGDEIAHGNFSQTNIIMTREEG